MKMKGISPLVAAVLLIAVTMTIAGALAFWASSFVQERTDAFANQSVANECSFAQIDVYSCSYDVNNSRVNLILNNIGRVDMSSLRMFAFYSNSSVGQYDLNGTIGSGILKSFVVDGVSSGITRISIRTQCPEVSSERVCS